MAPSISLSEVSLSTNPFNEEFQPKTRVSGSVVAGLVSYGANAKMPLDVAGYVPRDWAGQPVCLRVVTLNGFYEATNEYSVDASWQGGTDTFEYPTKYAEVLSKSQPSAIALKLQRGGCASSSQSISLSFWSGTDGGPPNILVNSFGADAVYIYVGDSLQSETCSEIELPSASAFDTSCSLSGAGAGVATRIEILRVMNSKPAPPEVIEVWLP